MSIVSIRDYYPDENVRTNPQQLSERQKAQARENIGAMSASGGGIIASAIPLSASGSVISSEIVSPLQHEVNCRLESTNCLEYPYRFMTDGQSFTRLGITLTGNADGSITVSGKAKGTSFIPFGKAAVTSGKMYMLLGFEGIVNQNFYVTVFDGQNYVGTNAGGAVFQSRFKNGQAVLNFNFTEGADFTAPKIAKPMLILKPESGELPPFAKMVSNLEGVEVYRYGKNLFDPENFQRITEPDLTQEADNGILHVKGARKKWSMTEPVTQKGMIGQFHVRLDSAVSFRIACIAQETGREIFTIEPGSVAPASAQLPELEAGEIFCLVAENNHGSIDDSFRIAFYKGEKPTAAEWRFLTPQIRKADETGCVDGVVSTGPSMTILTDTPGITVDADYYADTKGYIDREIGKIQLALIDQI